GTNQMLGVVRLKSIMAAVLVYAALHAGFANDDVLASAYGPVVRDLIAAFHAEITACHAAIEVPDVCFEVTASGAGLLAEAFETVMPDLRGADLRLGDWRSENGVWAITIYTGSGAHGTLEMFLTEGARGEVRGMFVLRQR